MGISVPSYLYYCVPVNHMRSRKTHKLTSPDGDMFLEAGMDKSGGP